MLVRCNGTEAQNEAIRACMRMRMRLAGLMDHTYHWQSSHPDNPKAHPERVQQWFQQQWRFAEKLDRKAIVAPGPDSNRFDKEICQFRLWYIEKWPVDKIVGKRVRDDGTFHAENRWIDRLIASIQKHGILDPILAWNHVPSQKIVGKPPGTPNVILGSNRIAVAQHLGIPHVPVVVSFPKEQQPRYASESWSFEKLHEYFNADLWVTPQDWYLVHPPTQFHDAYDGRENDLDERSTYQR